MNGHLIILETIFIVVGAIYAWTIGSEKYPGSKGKQALAATVGASIAGLIVSLARTLGGGL